MTVDTRKLVEAIKLHRQIRKHRTYAYITNRAIQNCVGKAIGPTPKADADKIAWRMGQTETLIGYVTKKGVYKRYKRKKRIYQFADSLAARIINLIRKSKGENLLFGDEMETQARKYVAYKLRSVGFIKSGWLPAFKNLSRLIGQALKIDIGGRQYGVPKGGLESAKTGKERCAANAWNNARMAGKIGLAAAQEAVNLVAREMVNWAIDNHKEAAEKAGFKVRLK